MSSSVTVRLNTDHCPKDGLVLIPCGIPTSLGGVSTLDVSGGDLVATTNERRSGQPAALVRPTGFEVTVRYALASPSQCGDTQRYPEAAFQPYASPFTDAATDLASASIKIAREAGGGRSAIRALIAEATERFTYDHPEQRFNDGLAEVPYLGCSIASGSCVDINTYLVASLRAAGIRAAYLYGYFFPQERDGYTVGMHCWVATSVDGILEEWDIAHHKKMGTDDISEGLNPKPGCRALIGHSMGHVYATPFGEVSTKLLASPMFVSSEGIIAKTKILGAWLDGDLGQAS